MENLDSIVMNVAETLMKNFLSHFFAGHYTYKNLQSNIISGFVFTHTVTYNQLTLFIF